MLENVNIICKIRNYLLFNTTLLKFHTVLNLSSTERNISSAQFHQIYVNQQNCNDSTLDSSSRFASGTPASFVIRLALKTLSPAYFEYKIKNAGHCRA